MMPRSWTLDSPLSTATKRPRSQETSNSQPKSAPHNQTRFPVSEQEDGGQSSRVGVKIPYYLNKSKTEIATSFQDLEWRQRLRLQQAFNNVDSPYQVDRSEAVLYRNRYLNIQPWKASRVRLNPPIDGSDYINASPITLRSQTRTSRQDTSAQTSKGQDDLDHSYEETKYVASQGPKTGQYLHFWQMVMQETKGDVGVIVMLTQCYEGNKEKCAQYFPLNKENPTITLRASGGGTPKAREASKDDGDPFLDSHSVIADTDDSTAGSTSVLHENEIDDNTCERDVGTVTLLSLETDAKIGCEVRHLLLRLNGASKQIYHFLFNAWPDFGKPEAEDRAALVELTRRTRALVAPDNSSPRIIHCSAGVGRTGTWIALDHLLHELERGNLTEKSSSFSSSSSSSSSSSHDSPNNQQPPSSATTWGKSGPLKLRVRTPDAASPEESDLIYRTVDTLREQRMMMVMNELQYSFIYEAVKEAFMEKHKEKRTGPVIISSSSPSSSPSPSSAGENVEEPSPKVARTTTTDLEKGKNNDDNDDAGDTISEAETEILEHSHRHQRGRLAGDIREPEEEEEEEEKEEDPYAQVAPETIREGMNKTEQKSQDVVGHELQ